MTDTQSDISTIEKEAQTTAIDVKQPDENGAAAAKVVVEEIGNFMKTVPGMLKDVSNATRWPKMPIREFSGDSIYFDSYIDFLPFLLEELEPDSKRRLCYLYQALTGKAKKVICPCLYEEHDDPYTRAKDVLKKYFGEKHIVATAKINRAVNGKNARYDDKENSMMGIWLDISCCRRLLEEPEYSGEEYNYSNMLIRIIRRLPRNLQEDWKIVADEIINVKCREITIKDIEEFVNANRWSRMRHPVLIPLPQTIENKTSICMLCEDVHSLQDCESFKDMTQIQRHKYATKNKLCISCLRPGHNLNACKSSIPCHIDSCNGKHHKLLHRYYD